MRGVTLAEFLLARIAEDEAVASAATPGPWQWWNLEGADQGWSDNGPTLETVARGPVYSDGSQGAAEDIIAASGHDVWGLDVSEADAAHIARYDPARVLAECEAKRRIVEAHDNQCPQCASGRRCVPHDSSAGSPTARYLDPVDWLTLTTLASVYADHPDYDESWRP